MAQWRKVIVSGSSAVLNQISASGNIVPTSDNGVDLGSSTLEFKDLYIDGTANVDSLVADTADINAGTVDAITSLTAAGNLDIGTHGFRANTLTADAQTSGRVAIYSTAGLLSEDGDLTFSSETLTATKIGAFEAAGAIDFSDEAMTNVDINSGAIDGVTIGGASAGAITGTTIDATTDFTIDGLVLTADTITNDAALTVVSTGLTFNASLDIALSADGGNVTMDDGTTTIFDFNVDDTSLTIHDDQDTGDTAVITMAQHGALSIVTTDDDAAAANIQITADGTAELAGTTVTLDSGANVVLSPAGGSHVKIDDVIQVDSGVLTGATSITSTTFVGTLDGAIGGTTPAAGVFTTVSASGVITAQTGIIPDANDGAYLGQAGTAFSDLFLAEGGVINWDSGDATLTQASNVVTLAGATLTGTLTNGLSVTANGGILMTSYNASAAVADLALDIDGMTDIGAAPATGDLFIIDDGANGTNRKSTIDRLATKFAGTGLTATSAVIAIDAADTTTTSIINASLAKIGTNASQEYITFGTANEVNTFVDNTERLSVTATGVDITGVATVSSDLTVGGNLDVNGTLTTIDTANSYVADKFMIIASGSTSDTDGGIIVQGGVTSGYALGYDSGTDRWALDADLAHNATNLVPDAYVGVVQYDTTAGDSYAAPLYGGAAGHGTIYVDTDDGEIWIYA